MRNLTIRLTTAYTKLEEPLFYSNTLLDCNIYFAEGLSYPKIINQRWMIFFDYKTIVTKNSHYDQQIFFL